MTSVEADDFMSRLGSFPDSVEDQSGLLGEIALVLEQPKSWSEETGRDALRVCDKIGALIDKQAFHPDMEASAFFALGKCLRPECAVQVARLAVEVSSRISDRHTARNVLIALDNFLWIEDLLAAINQAGLLPDLDQMLDKLDDVWKDDEELSARVRQYTMHPGND